MQLHDAVNKAIAAFHTRRESDEHEIVEMLVASGIEKPLAAKLVEFVPLAFFRAMMEESGVQFADYFLRLGPEGKPADERKLNQEPVYMEALKMALAEAKAGRGGEDYLAVARRSAEFQAINNALHDGAKLEDLVCAPPVLLWSESSDEPAE